MTDHAGTMMLDKNSPASCELRGHADDRRYPVSDSQHIPEGLCKCGCGQRTQMITQWRMRGGRVLRRGDYADYVNGHSPRVKAYQGYEVSDMGFESPCWLWRGSLTQDGYGRAPLRNGTQLAHRQNFIDKAGPLKSAEQLDHLCRVRNCVNPDHLEVVSNAENQRRGKNAKLTIEGARAIRRSSDSAADLASRYGVSATTVYKIRNGEAWRDA